ncbi:hypothetical protein BH09ACT10_BH09ACT10_19080 [soil metagenome]
MSIPLIGNTVGSYALTLWTARVETVATDWIKDTPGASLTRVDTVSNTFYIFIQTPSDLPSLDQLMADLEGSVPDGFKVVVESSQGEQLESRTVGDN